MSYIHWLENLGSQPRDYPEFATFLLEEVTDSNSLNPTAS
jgi:hypothetical protein